LLVKLLLLSLLINDSICYINNKSNNIRNIKLIKVKINSSSSSSSTSLSSAKEALDLLHYGHQSQLSDNITWIILITGAYYIQYKIFRMLANN
jgi:hypothetical protein